MGKGQSTELGWQRTRRKDRVLLPCEVVCMESGRLPVKKGRHAGTFQSPHDRQH